MECHRCFSVRTTVCDLWIYDQLPLDRGKQMKNVEDDGNNVEVWNSCSVS